MTYVLCALIGLVAGVGGGMFGIGGGIIIVPALVGLLGFTQHRAQGTSLVALLAPVGLLSVMNYYKANNADLRAGAVIAVLFFFGAYLGSKLSLNLNDVAMRKGFACFLVVVGCYMFLKK